MDETPKVHDKFHTELEELTAKLMRLAGMAERALKQAVDAFFQRNPEVARQIIQGDKAINDLEEELDADCVRIVALYQPVAVDLRQVMAVDHLIVELERLGDIAVNIAEETLELVNMPRKELHRDLGRMRNLVESMIRDSLRAFLERDGMLARQVCHQDDEVDYLDRAIIQDLLQFMGRSPEDVAFGLCQITVVRNLERAGDHATNIAEQVVFMVEGESIRHRCQG